MAKAMRDASLSSFARTLQLVVHDGVLAQQAVINMLRICCRIVRHFKHSSVAYDSLRKIQKNLKLPQHRLKQDEPMRWNSTLYMIQSIVEQKVAIAAYAADGAIPQLTAYQFDLAENVISTLNPIEEITRAVSYETACISVVIPIVRALARYLDKHDNDSGVRTMKSEMLDSLNRRFENMENEEFLLLSTALDPRYKDKFFTTNSVRSEAKRILKQNCAIENHDEPPAKRPHTEQEGSKNTCDLWTCFSKIIEESGIDEIQTSDEVDKYLGECLIDFKKGNPYLWWNQNKERYPKLSDLA